MRDIDVINAVYEELQALRMLDLVPAVVELGDQEYEAAQQPRTMFGLPVRHVAGKQGVTVLGTEPPGG